jgi:predicted alpha/beta hydrolase
VTETLQDEAFSDDIIVPAADGYPLAATLFLPRGPKRHAVLINAATATPRKIYRGFAGYLARRGCAVLTYDYRGIGGSRQKDVVGYDRPKSLVGFKASMADWAALDVTATVAWMRERYHALPLTYVGHSFGGQALGLLTNNTEVSRALLIASQAATWKLMASPERYRVYALMRGVGVPLTRVLGYAPGWAGIGEDLPKDAFLQWARWVMSPRYLFDDEGLVGLSNFARFRAALRARALHRRRSLGDAAGGRTAVLGIFRDHAGDHRPDAGQGGRGADRPFRLLPPRASRAAVARRGGLDPDGVTLSFRGDATGSARSAAR